MKLAYYCQHVLGIGHFHRSLEICRAFAPKHDVTMIVGGPEVPVKDSSISFVHLPALRMNEQFKALEPCDPALHLETVKKDRCRQLIDFISTCKPDCLIIELYPFGRKAFRFELEPLLSYLESIGRPCKVYCSLRDILVEKTEGRDKFEQRAVDTLNNYFDGLLIHSDKRLISLERTFTKTAFIKTPLFYTGFISPRPSVDARKRIRTENNITEEQHLIIASIGGGSVGSELLLATAEAVALLQQQNKDCTLQIFTGPYLDNTTYNSLIEKQNSRLRVDRFTDNFVDWLKAADLSISMAGYNTSMNSIAAGVPTLMYPFDQNREQRLRVEKFSCNNQSIALLEDTDLRAERLAQLIEGQLQREHITPDIDLDGANQTVKIVEAG